MTTQTQEAARQILGAVSDTHAVTSLCGLPEVNVKLAAIREKASFLLEGNMAAEKIVQNYEHDADMSIALLGEKINELSGCDSIEDGDRLQVIRLAEVLLQRNRVYFDRRTRHQLQTENYDG